MTIKINNISIKNLGPIKEFNHKLGKLNLVYGKNGTGKSMLTEFIIKTLFNNTKPWEKENLRELYGCSGKISVEGLTNGLTDFHFTKKEEKLDDLWQNQDNIIPNDFCNLLVAIDKKLELSSSKEGIDYNTIKDLFSEEPILEKIDDNISKTIKYAEINEDQEISIRNLGEGKEYRNLKEKVNTFQQLQDKIKITYSEADPIIHNKQIKTLKDEIEKLEESKKHKAYILNEKIKNKKKLINAMPDEDIINDLNTCRTLKQTIDQKRKDIKDNEDKIKNHTEFCTMESEYRNLISNEDRDPSLVDNQNKSKYNPYLISSFLFFLLFLFSQFFFNSNHPIYEHIPLLPLIISIILAYCFYANKIKVTDDNYNRKNQIAKDELERIKERFKELTGTELNTIADISTIIENQKSNIAFNDIKRNELIGDRDKFKDLENKLKNEMSDEDYKKDIKQLKTERKNISTEIEQLNKELLPLNIDESDYLSNDNGVKYSNQDYEDKTQDLENKKEELQTYADTINELKADLCKLTSNTVTYRSEIDEIIQDFDKENEEENKKFKNLEAEIIAQNTVHKVIKDLKDQEFDKIKTAIESKEMKKYLKLMTRFNNISFDNVEDKKILISSNTEELKPLDLSKGEKETVMLAMRVAFCAKLIKKNHLFLVLDNVFQNCDSDVRENLVDSLIKIVEEGWQILYLTMDDHIYTLFDKKAKSIPTYRCIKF